MITSPRAHLLSSLKQQFQFRTCKMDNQPTTINTTTDKVYFQYNHTDSCKSARWNARESYVYMYERPWQQVVDFYSDVVKGILPISSLITTQTHVEKNPEIAEPFFETETLGGKKEDKTGRWARVSYKIILAYHGGSFNGWQTQPGLHTVQGLIERSLGRFVDEKKVEKLKSKGSPIEARALVAGRTDKGVTALQQVCSFYTWRKDLCVKDIEDAINSAEPGRVRVVSVSQVSRAFHPNFSAKYRHYLYIFPLDDENDGKKINVSGVNLENVTYNQDRTECTKHLSEENFDDEDENESGNKPTGFQVNRVNTLLRQLEGKLLSYRMFARDTKPSRNVGPPTECFLYHARACEARLPGPPKDAGEGANVMCVELVANRFLRKMVRVLVATAIREAAAGAEDDALIKLMDATCRRATAPPAPSDGLCFVNAGYTEFDPSSCLIP